MVVQLIAGAVARGTAGRAGAGAAGRSVSRNVGAGVARRATSQSSDDSEGSADEKPRVRIFTILAMCLIAFVFDAAQFVLTLVLPGFGLILGIFITVSAGLIFFLWFALLRVPILSGKQAMRKTLTAFGALGMEIVPFFGGMLFTITGGVVMIIIGSRIEDATGGAAALGQVLERRTQARSDLQKRQEQRRKEASDRQKAQEKSQATKTVSDQRAKSQRTRAAAEERRRDQKDADEKKKLAKQERKENLGIAMDVVRGRPKAQPGVAQGGNYGDEPYYPPIANDNEEEEEREAA